METSEWTDKPHSRPLQPVLDNGRVTNDGGTIYNKFSMELRYPISLKQQAKIYLVFL